MLRCWIWLMLLTLIPASADAQNLLSQVGGTWAIGGGAACIQSPYEWTVETGAPNTLVFRDRRGRPNREIVESEWGGGFTSMTVASPDVPVGTRWSYTLGRDTNFLVRNLQTGAQFVLARCPSSVPRSRPAATDAPRFDSPVALVAWLLDHSTDQLTSPNVFSPGLLAAIRASQLRAGDERPCGLGSDFIRANQESGPLTNVRLVPHPTAADRVTVEAWFITAGDPRHRLFMTVLLDGAWKLENINESGFSFRRALACQN